MRLGKQNEARAWETGKIRRAKKPVAHCAFSKHAQKNTWHETQRYTLFEASAMGQQFLIERSYIIANLFPLNH
jgi:hypothetical protein